MEVFRKGRFKIFVCPICGKVVESYLSRNRPGSQSRLNMFSKYFIVKAAKLNNKKNKCWTKLTFKSLYVLFDFCFRLGCQQTTSYIVNLCYSRYSSQENELGKKTTGMLYNQKIKEKLFRSAVVRPGQ